MLHCTSFGPQPQTCHLWCISDEQFSRYTGNRQTDRSLAFIVRLFQVGSKFVSKGFKRLYNLYNLYH